MAAKFKCPHCEAAYPSLASLVGRSVRCSHCQQPFQLQKDGSVKKLAVTQVHKQDKELEKQREEKREEMTRTLTRKELGTRARRLKEKAQEMRSSLRSAASAALEVVEARVEDKIQERKQVKKPQSLSDFQPATHQAADKQNKKPIVLVAGLCCLIIIAIVLFGFELSPQQQALRDFSKNVEESQVKYPHRLTAYLSRCWLATIDGDRETIVVLNADEAVIESVPAFDWSTAGAVIYNVLKDRHAYRKYALFAKPGLDDQLQQLQLDYQQQANDKFAHFHDFLRAQKFDFISYREIPSRLRSKQVSPVLIRVTSWLLAGTDNRKGGNKYFDQFAKGQFPSSIELAKFSGDEGLRLVEKGMEYDVEDVGYYEGYLLKFGDSAWDEGWKVLSIVDKYAENPLERLTKRIEY